MAHKKKNTVPTHHDAQNTQSGAQKDLENFLRTAARLGVTVAIPPELLKRSSKKVAAAKKEKTVPEIEPDWSDVRLVCPNCKKTKPVVDAEGKGQEIGLRRVVTKKLGEVKKPQSWCRECRAKTNYHLTVGR